jgi:hypothetical protein
MPDVLMTRPLHDNKDNKGMGSPCNRDVKVRD